ncbi:MAG TPA: phosphatase PAP2 family protein [Gemmatimonadaceae bacterium]
MKSYSSGTLKCDSSAGAGSGADASGGLGEAAGGSRVQPTATAIASARRPQTTPDFRGDATTDLNRARFLQNVASMHMNDAAEPAAALAGPSDERRPSHDEHATRRWLEVVGLGVLALFIFALIGEDVFEHAPLPMDTAVRAWVLAHQSRLAYGIFHAITIVGGVNTLAFLGIAGGLYLWKRGHSFVAFAVLLAPLVSIVTYLGVKHLYARRRPPSLGRIFEGTYAFPSAHSTASAAICGTLAYVFWRQGIVPGWVALCFAILVPLAIGASRVYLDVHWASDVLGGWSAGVLVAVMSAALYNANGRGA